MNRVTCSWGTALSRGRACLPVGLRQLIGDVASVAISACLQVFDSATTLELAYAR
jgi:hypothetical protein